jgi:hypothetical protein
LSGYFDPWTVLGIAQTRDKAAIRRAYSTQLKRNHPEDDAEAFKRLRSAYEWALGWTEFDPEGDGVDAVEPALAAVPAPPTSAPAPDAPVDEPAAALDGALRKLSQELDSPAPDPEKMFALLEAATSPAILERVDLSQRAEVQIGAILLNAAPRSDLLLRRANKVFDWTGREDTRRRPVYIERLLARMADLDFLDNLMNQASAQSNAWKRLQHPEPPRRRFIRAYLQHHTWWPELELIRRLENEHPEMLANLPAENLAWWRRFASRPRFSWLTLGAWFFPALALCAWLVPGETGAPRGGLLFGGAVVIAIGAALFKMYLVDWPVALVQRRWGTYLPGRLALGWLPVGCALMALEVIVRSLPVLAWLVAALACATALWATAVGGERLSTFAGGGLTPLNSRVVSIVYFNALMFVWLWTLASTAPDIFSPPLLVSIGAALCGSVVAREHQVRAYLSLPYIWQRRLCLLGIAAGILFTFILLARFDVPQWQAPLAVLLVSITILRRSVRVPLTAGQFGSQFLVMYLVMGTALMRTCSSAIDSSDSLSPSAVLLVGGIFLMVGLIFAAGTQLSQRIELRT